MPVAPVAVLDLALLEPQAQASAPIDELKRLQLVYLEACIEGHGSRRR